MEESEEEGETKMMTTIMKKHLKKNKKGFTLVEVVVVLVILAILAAIAIPALTGYIDDANKRSATTGARTALVGLQHLASTNKTDNNATTTGGYFNSTGKQLSGKGVTQLNTLTGEKYTNAADVGSNSASIRSLTISPEMKVTHFTYNNGSYTVKYVEGSFQAPSKNK